MEFNKEILIQVLEKDFGPDKHLPSVADLEKLRLWILPKVKRFLDCDMQGLLNLMYRLDIDEERFKNILSESKTDEICSDLCDLIIERELLKVKYRALYS